MFPDYYNAYRCNVSSSVLNNSTLSALQCVGAPGYQNCIAICPNADLSGIGVRIAFYVQSVMNTLLVIYSPRDSVPSAWGGTILTASLIIAAIVQKAQHSITLHHAILILNFATLSCVSSLAVAPMLPIWRLTPSQYYRSELDRHGISSSLAPHGEDGGEELEDTYYKNKHKRKIEAAQTRGRVILTVAILAQVVFQWSWGILLFLSPVYSQTACSGGTTVLFFLAPFTVAEINSHQFAVWPLWLLFCLGITLALTCGLVLSSPSRAHDNPSHSAFSASTTISTATPTIQLVLENAIAIFPARNDRTKQLIFWSNIVCMTLWIIFVISSEWQIQLNCIFTGENSFQGFGQITAFLLSLTPLWSLTAAIYKYPSRLRRETQRRLREQRALSEETRSLLMVEPPSPSPSDRSLSPTEGTTPPGQLTPPDQLLSVTPVALESRQRRRLGHQSNSSDVIIDIFAPLETSNEHIELTYLPRAPPG